MDRPFKNQRTGVQNPETLTKGVYKDDVDSLSEEQRLGLGPKAPDKQPFKSLTRVGGG